jgi:hypothetical protein
MKNRIRRKITVILNTATFFVTVKNRREQQKKSGSAIVYALADHDFLILAIQ